MAHPWTYDTLIANYKITSVNAATMMVVVGVTLQTPREDSPFSFSHPLPATLTGNSLPWKAPSYSTTPNIEASTDIKVALKS